MNPWFFYLKKQIEYKEEYNSPDNCPDESP